MAELELDKLVLHFAQSNKAEGKSPKTISWYTEMLHDFIRFLCKGDRNVVLAGFDVETVREFIVHEQGRGISPYTVQGKVRALKVFGKGAKERIVPVGALAQKMLWRYLIHFRPEPEVESDNYLFLTLDDQPLKANAVKLLMKRWGKKAGVPRLHAHLCRHTYTTNFLNHNCGDVFRLQQILGHTTLEMRTLAPSLIDS